MLAQYIRIFLSLITIGALLYFVFYVLTKLPGNKLINKKNKRLNFIEQMYINPNAIVYLIGVDNQEFLMGVSNKTINFVQPLKERADFAKVLQEKELEPLKNAEPLKTKIKAKTKDSKDGFN